MSMVLDNHPRLNKVASIVGFVAIAIWIVSLIPALASSVSLGNPFGIVINLGFMVFLGYVEYRIFKDL